MEIHTAVEDNFKKWFANHKTMSSNDAEKDFTELQKFIREV